MLSAKAWLAGFGSDAGGPAFSPSLVLVFKVGGDGQGFVFGQTDQPVLVSQDLAGQLGWIDTTVDGRQLILLGGGEDPGVQEALIGSLRFVIDAFASPTAILGSSGGFFGGGEIVEFQTHHFPQSS